MRLRVMRQDQQPIVCDDGPVKRLVFLDLDGTLLNHDQQLPRSTRNALEQAIAVGHRLVMCTGRSKLEIYPFLWELGFAGLVGSNGAYGQAGDVTLFDERMPREDVSEISSWLESVGAESLWQTAEALYPTQGFLSRFQSDDAGDRTAAGDWGAYLEQVGPHLREGLPKTAAKVTMFLPFSSGASLLDAHEQFGERFAIIDGSVPHPLGEMGELTARGMNKSVGLARFAARLGVTISETIAIGDSANDIEMLRAAGIGVAMGNGTPEAKAAADWTTTSIDDDGVTAAFEKLSLVGAPV